MNDTTFEARCAMFSGNPLVASARVAADSKALAKAKREFNKASDAGTTLVPDGVFFHFYELRKAELAAMITAPRSAADARADRVLRIRDSSGCARGRKGS